ncbi:hypothetical protein RBH29_15415 [Herbivorax sp. ANBcel31]|uniref:hypothetical protein n=1 Tax=Herbivorax sp. ANBcel31 TaxID=3069754 RepID=UPI0027B0E6CE|nr:hypothetical protein [Herbivorax sp. ANBcel31]MDQ2087819.1 hypothetical protein [Herbivorax sp. ANBcel31]
MVLKKGFSGSYKRLVKRMKRDLLKSLGEKGVRISNINVALGKDKLKLKVSMRE